MVSLNGEICIAQHTSILAGVKGRSHRVMSPTRPLSALPDPYQLSGFEAADERRYLPAGFATARTSIGIFFLQSQVDCRRKSNRDRESES